MTCTTPVCLLAALALAGAWTAEAAAQSGDVTIWPPTATPAVVETADPDSVELGVKFRSDAAGTIVALRFYKGAGNVGPHVGNLWDAAGTTLTRITFTGETASGWQQMDLPSPVPIAAGTTYVASVFCPQGRYSADNGAFAGQGRDAPPLHALADGTEGGNGTYVYASSTSFPTQTFQSTNYWVDVVFRPAATPPPTPPPPPPGGSPPAVGDGRAGDGGKSCGCGAVQPDLLSAWAALAALGLLAGVRR